MQNFFDLNEHAEVLIPMYGTIHLITLAVMLVILPVMIWKKETVKKLVDNQRFISRVAIVYLAIETLYWIMMWSFPYQPFNERFPFHLCGTLSLLLPILILTKRYDALRFFTFWSIGAGFISLVNPSFLHDKPWSFGFIDYLIRHYFLFLFPIFLFIGKGYVFNYRLFLKSMFALMGYSFVMFLVNWVFGTNYMHLGQNNPLPIPFLPKGLSVWPWTYPSFVFVGIILFHVIYLIFYLSRKHESVRRI